MLIMSVWEKAISSAKSWSSKRVESAHWMSLRLWVVDVFMTQSIVVKSENRHPWLSPFVLQMSCRPRTSLQSPLKFIRDPVFFCVVEASGGSVCPPCQESFCSQQSWHREVSSTQGTEGSAQSGDLVSTLKTSRGRARPILTKNGLLDTKFRAKAIFNLFSTTRLNTFHAAVLYLCSWCRSNDTPSGGAWWGGLPSTLSAIAPLPRSDWKGDNATPCLTQCQPPLPPQGYCRVLQTCHFISTWWRFESSPSLAD